MAAAAPARRGPVVESTASWRLTDRIGLGLCWAAGLLLCLIAAGIVLYMAYRGLQYLRPHLLWERPLSDSDQSNLAS